MLTLTRKSRALICATAFVAGATGLVGMEPADARTNTCSAAVVVYEDGSWAGGPVTTNGIRATDAWVPVGPGQQGRVYVATNGISVLQTSFPPTSHGVQCKTYIVRGHL